MNDELYHYGTPRHSGRYPWGSGDNPYQRNKGLLGRVNDLKKQGLSEVEIAKALKMKNTKQLRAQISIAKSETMAADAAMAYRLKEKGYSNVAIAKRMGTIESNVRNYLKPSYLERAKVLTATSDMLKDNVEKQRFIDIGRGVESHLGISQTKLDAAVEILKEKGYHVYNVYVKQIATGKDTTIKVLAAPDVTYGEVVKNRHEIGSVVNFSENGGVTYEKPEPPRSINSDRVQIRYKEDGGIQKDGVIELRRGVPELNLGNAKYAQVRIAVDGSHYLKGMAMYSDDIPDGVDIVFNTNKSKDIPKMKVLKEMSSDPANPFGASIKKEEDLKLIQRHYLDKEGKRQLSALNIVNEEGSWGDWSKTLSSQFLSKQTPALAKKQLDLAFNIKKDEFNDILSLTNPAVKKNLLNSFADECDSDAVHLSAAALPRQGWHAILPIPKIKGNEIYAPNYRDGEEVALVRFPHGGTFEIPTLVVNNKQPDAVAVMKNARDAIGIHPKVAERLSGADFDGDTVLVIPTSTAKILTSPPLKGLEGFDPKEAYPAYEGMKPMTARMKGIQMGVVSNLITDMTIKGASSDELARAVRHSMVVIDAEKHKLNYKQSYIDNDIDDLKRRYQSSGDKVGGVSTLISRAGSEQRVPKRKELTNIRRMTPEQIEDFKAGKKVYEETGETYTTTSANKKGEVKTTEHLRTESSTRMAETKDANTLSSGTYIETIYANYANQMKDLANQARKAYRETPNAKYDPTAKKVYAEEVSSLNSKLQRALKNAPLERKAQSIANNIIDTRVRDDPSLKTDKSKYKKVKWQALEEGRRRTGAGKEVINITPKEWEAIQSGAITHNTLSQILLNAKPEQVKSYATPKTKTGLSASKKAMAKSLLKNGYPQADVADQLGVSVSLIRELIE